MPKSHMHHKAEGNVFEYARKLRKESTEAEDILWQRLRGRKQGVKFRRQHPIDKYIVDFFSFEIKLIIEVDGGIHLNPEVKQNDMDRQTFIQSLGYRFLRFTNDEVENETGKVLEKIVKEIKKFEA